MKSLEIGSSENFLLRNEKGGTEREREKEGAGDKKPRKTKRGGRGKKEEKFELLFQLRSSFWQSFSEAKNGN